MCMLESVNPQNLIDRLLVNLVCPSTRVAGVIVHSYAEERLRVQSANPTASQLPFL
jgi:hypothetical protein